jgi:hypothetical protein
MALSINFGVNCPHPQDLRTGDLLFPRSVQPLAFVPQYWNPGQLDPNATFAMVIAERSPVLYSLIQSNLAQARLLKGYSPDLSSIGALGAQYVELMKAGAKVEVAGSGFDLDNPRVLMFLYKVMQLAFADLVDSWLKMTINEFVTSDIGKFLLKTLTATDPRDGFFVGHLAMVVREHQGQVTSGAQGEAYVIEANTTDFSHYRVAVHPYCPAGDIDPAAPRAALLARGWVTRRLAMDEKVWLARPQLSASGAHGSPDAQRQALADHAKALHGRPYGFFDDPRFGDADHLYCSEFLYVVFRSAAGLSLEEHRSWKWVKDYLLASAQHELHALVLKVMQKSGLKDTDPFFVLTPPMIWSSNAVGQHWRPEGEGPYSPPVP